jgi:hypothetical protein
MIRAFCLPVSIVILSEAKDLLFGRNHRPSMVNSGQFVVGRRMSAAKNEMMPVCGD